MKKIRNNRKQLLLLAAVVLVMTVSVGGTLMYLTAGSQTVTNILKPAKVDISIAETFDGTVKSNVSIKNEDDDKHSTVAAYIRAEIVVTWQNPDGKNVIPAKDGDYELVLDLKNGWTEKDGIYYWKDPVAPGGQTGVLIETAKPVVGKAPAGYVLHVEVLAQGIQADGNAVVVDANGCWLSVK